MAGTSDRTFVIVGAGTAGATAALTLRSSGFDGRVVLVGDEEHPPYNRPPLTKGVVRGELAPERTQMRPAKVWTVKDIELVLGRAAVGLDVATRTLTLADGEALRYDELLLATGGRARTLPGLSEGGVTHVVRTLDDAIGLRRVIAAGSSLAIVGAGFVGAELAASAVQSGCEVTLLEAGPLPLARVLPAALGEHYAQLHRARGVDLITNAMVIDVVSTGDGLRVVRREAPPVEADAVVLALGLELDLSLARAAGLAVDDGIVVDACCRTSAPHVFAAGDVARHDNPLLGRSIRVEHWQHAQHQGAAAARNMLGAGETFSEVPWVWSDQYEHKLEIAGIAEPGDDVVLRGDPAAGAFAAFLLRDGELAAAVGVDRADDVRAARAAIGRRARPAPQLLADPSVDLVGLLDEDHGTRGDEDHHEPAPPEPEPRGEVCR